MSSISTLFNSFIELLSAINNFVIKTIDGSIILGNCFKFIGKFVTLHVSQIKSNMPHLFDPAIENYKFHP